MRPLLSHEKVWDATCPDTFAPSHITLNKRGRHCGRRSSVERKKQKYSSLMTGHNFVFIAIETSGVFGSEAITFFKELGQWTKFDFWRPLFLIQRAAGNPAREHGSSTWNPPSLTVCILLFCISFRYTLNKIQFFTPSLHHFVLIRSLPPKKISRILSPDSPFVVVYLTDSLGTRLHLYSMPIWQLFSAFLRTSQR